MNSSPSFMTNDASNESYIRHEQTMIPSSNVDDTRKMVHESIAGRRHDIHSIIFSGDLMACPNCGRETGGPKYCGNCS